MAIDDVRDFLTALSAARVDFVIVGAHALAVHGLVRATGDLDVRGARTPAREVTLRRP
ncbi:MAG: hypothetical protein IPH07_31875 [Deltaproteobacteria bacterium]|nr:hypothetical protein [Deltaproteobacteria bacterium]MBK8715516.1 hypothetical protein [Deltaproteobacteria bacterium]MBP7288418.1 hypothetical protein [Nannocystaceae bacterium]